MEEKTQDEIPNARRAQAGLQSLIKGDVVFSLANDQDAVIESWWTSIFKHGGGQKDNQNAKYTTGTVLLNKEWRDSSFYLYIKWENGKCENVSDASTHVVYGDNLFVLDRECVSRESKVHLAGYPDVRGTVKEKRLLATGRCLEHPDVIFEDIDISLLQRLPYGPTFKQVKILYQDCWLGITFNYRIKLHLKLITATDDNKPLYLILDGDSEKQYKIGDVVALGFNVMRSGELVTDEELSSNGVLKFLNTLRFLNAHATITNITLEELHVHWIGKAGDPETYLTSNELPDSPATTIPHSELKHFRFLWGEKQCQVIPKSIWKYTHNPSGKGGDSVPISNEKWVSKWLKLVDWGSWEYPIVEDNLEKSQFWEKELTLEIMYVRSVVDVVWKNGSVSTVNSGELIPVHLGSIWFDWTWFCSGTIVADRMDKQSSKRYGIILHVNDDETATVNWIQPGLTNSKGDLMTAEMINAPMYDLIVKNGYDFISRPNNCPLVFPLNDQFKVGVITGMKSENGQVRVKLSEEEEEKAFWPHQLSHYKCDVAMCPRESCWVAWYDHITTLTDPTGTHSNWQSMTLPSDENNTEVENAEILSTPNPKKKLTYMEEVPRDHLFLKETLTTDPLELEEFCHDVEKELAEINSSTPDGMWIEYYSDPGNLLTAVMTGTKGSLFEDFLFIFDIFLFEDFPETDPHLSFRSLGITILPEHFCKSGTATLLDENSNLTKSDVTSSDILNALLEIRKFLGIPLKATYEKNKVKADTNLDPKHENCEELVKFALISLLDYSIKLLQNPPINWDQVIKSHFAKALPRIFKKFEQIQEEAKDDKEKGDLPKMPPELELLSGPWSKTYQESIQKRIHELKKAFAEISNEM